ncbi:hypothetical protein GGR57DRAFT_476783 [Xylariaceae sp. FL1272]|nr:hypothetical protein GGR57DRAFT_476783 [Xylariaceae sp. FL1272]
MSTNLTSSTLHSSPTTMSTTRWVPSSSPNPQQHAALHGKPSVPLTNDQWRNIHSRIIKTVDIVLAHDFVFRGPGPQSIELHANLGIALVVENIIRPIQIPCKISNPAIQRKIRAMASDIKHHPFRYTYVGGRVWFSFNMLDADQAVRPIGESPKDYKSAEAEEQCCRSH